MSIHSMTNVAVVRKLGPKKAAGITEEAMMKDAAGVEETAGEQGAAVTAALNLITAYIPTEVITLYVAVVAALSGTPAAAQPAPGNQGASVATQEAVRSAEWLNFYVFLIFTPIAVWLIYAAKLKADKDLNAEDKKLPWSPARWPKWEMIAAAVAFVAWAFALPETPFRDSAFYNQALSGIVVLAVSTLLGLVAPLVPRAKD